MFIITHWRGTSKAHTLTILKEDGSAYNLAAEDEAIFRVGRGDTEPDLEITSFETLPGGSVVDLETAGDNIVALYIAGPDTVDMLPGVFDAQLVVIDHDDRLQGQEQAKHVDMGVFVLKASTGPAGDAYTDEQSSSSGDSSGASSGSSSSSS